MDGELHLPKGALTQDPDRLILIKALHIPGGRGGLSGDISGSPDRP